MSDWLSGFSAIAKSVTPQMCLALTFASSFALFLPKSVILYVGLDEIISAYRPFIAAVLFVSSSLLLSYVFFWIVPFFIERLNDYQESKNRKSLFRYLTKEEKQFLSAYINDDVTVQYMSLQDGISSGLQAKKIIYRSSQLSTPGQSFPYNLQPWAKIYLTKHPEALN